MVRRERVDVKRVGRRNEDEKKLGRKVSRMADERLEERRIVLSFVSLSTLQCTAPRCTALLCLPTHQTKELIPTISYCTIIFLSQNYYFLNRRGKDG